MGMFGKKTKAKPTRVFKYGAVLTADNEKIAKDIIFHANRFKHALIELDIKRRKQVDQVLAELSDDAKAVQEEIAEADAKVDAAIKVIHDARIRLQSKKVPEELVDAMRAEKRARAVLYKKRSDINKPLYALPEFKERQAVINAEVKEGTKQLRAQYGAEGLHWGTRGGAEIDMRDVRKGAPPRHKPFNGSGRVHMQVHNSWPGNIADARDGGRGIGNILQLGEMCDYGKKSSYCEARIRIGTEDRKPVWLPFSVKFHKGRKLEDIPEDGEITQVSLVGKRYGAKVSWTLQISIARDSWGIKRQGNGVVAVVPGWSSVADGVRSAVIAGADGSYEEVVLENDYTVNRLRKADEIQSRRDKLLSHTRKELLSMLKEMSSPDELRERVSKIRQSQQKLATVVLGWRQNRWDGDEDVFLYAEEWRKCDKRLLSRQANLVRKVSAHRKDVYRNLAADLADKYDTILVPDTNWAKMQELMKEEEDTGVRKVSASFKEARRVASPGQLVECLVTTGLVQKVPSENLSAICGGCQEVRPCDCGVSDAESRALNLFRRYFSEGEIAKLFKQRNVMQMIRLMAASVPQVDEGLQLLESKGE